MFQREMSSNPLLTDTALEAARFQFSILRSHSSEERVAMAIELSDSLRSTVEEGIRQRHPEYTERMVHLAALRLSIGEELYQRCCLGIAEDS